MESPSGPAVGGSGVGRTSSTDVEDRPAFRLRQPLAPAGTIVDLERPRVLARWGPEAVLILVVAGILPLLGSLWFHSLGQPAADDWTYLNALAQFSQHGTLDFSHWGTTMIVGQLLLVAPLYLVFGVHPVLAVLAVWGTGLIGMCGLSYLCRRCGMSRRTAAVIVTLVALCPLFLSLDVTFMTDVPCFTAMILTLCLWVDCRQTARFTARRWMALGLATLAFSIREPAAVVVVPVLLEPILAAWRRRQRAASLRCLGIATGWAVVMGALWLWRDSNPTTGWVPVHFSIVPLLRWWSPGWLPALLGLFALPVLLRHAPWRLIPQVFRRHRRLSWVLGVLVLVLPLAGLLKPHQSLAFVPQLGNSFSQDLFLPVGLRLLLYFSGLCSLWASLLILVDAAPALRKADPASRRILTGIKTVIALYVVIMVVLAVMGVPAFDRYWLIVIALGAILLDRSASGCGSEVLPLHRRSRVRRWAAAGPLVVIGFFGLACYGDDAVASSAIWNVATAAATHLPSGYGPEDIAADWRWDLFTYASHGPVDGTTPTTHDGRFLYLSHDRSHSFVYLNRYTASTCGPWKVVLLTPHETASRSAIAVGPLVHGLFVQMQFEVVRLTHPDCAGHLSYDRHHLGG